MSLNKFLSETQLIDAFYEQEIIFFAREGPNSVTSWFRTDVSERLRRTVALHVGLEGAAVNANTYCLNQVLFYGPKILRLTNLDYELLEETEMNVPLAEYKQPYKAMVVEFPEQYLKTREVENVEVGLISPSTMKIQTQINTPRCVLVVHDELNQVLILDVLFNNGQGFTCSIRNLEKDIEQNFVQLMDTENLTEDSLNITAEENETVKKLMRAAVNACMIATEMGFVRKGPQNPTHYRRLQHFVDVARKNRNPERIARSQRDVRQHPQILEIDQEVFLRTARERDRTEGGTGREVGPHRRKGHHRMQPYGPGNSLRKRKWIPPTRVNWHKFGGKDCNTSVVITNKEE